MDKFSIVRICDRVSKYSLYTLIFLLPVFFLPLTSNVLDFNKQILLIILVSVSLFAQMLKILITKEFTININKVGTSIAVLFLVSAVATIFSISRYGSFWGWPQVISEGLVTFMGLLVFYFLVSSIFSKEEIKTSVTILSVSSCLVLLIGILQVFGLYIIPADFARSQGFNTIGGLSSLGLFLLALLPLAIMSSARKRILTIILISTVVFSGLLLILINHTNLWWLTLVGSALLMFMGIQKKDSLNSKLLFIPMIFLAISLFFVIIRPSINLLPKLPIEIYLNQKSSLGIDWQVLKHAPILGTGPGTFSQDFSKYKSVNFNQGMFWNTTFNSATSKVLNVLATTGILGLLAYLYLISLVVYCGVKFFFIDKRTDDPYWNTILGVFVGIIVLTVSAFLAGGSGVTIEFIFFFLIAAFIGLTSGEKKERKLEGVLNLSITFIFTLFIIFAFGLLIFMGQKYIAEAYYNSGLNDLQAGKGDQSLLKVEKAASLNSGADIYFRQLSQLYILKLADVVNGDMAEDKKNETIKVLINNAINSAKIATDLNPKNVINWSSRGYIFQNLVGAVDGAEEWAIKSYDEAIALDPNNPYYPGQKGVAYLQQATLAKGEEKTNLLTQAKEQLNKAIELKSDYAPAHFQLAMVAQAEGKTDEAIKGLEDTVKLAPNDVGLAFQLGVLYYQDKNYEWAKAEFERSLVIEPNYANSIFYLGLTYYAQDQTSKAIEAINKVLELNPGNETAIKVLANIKAGKDPFSGEEAKPIEEK